MLDNRHKYCKLPKCKLQSREEEFRKRNCLEHTKEPPCLEHTKEPPITNCLETKQPGLKSCLAKVCRGDLYVLGRIWIETLRSGLVGSKWSIIPVLEASPPNNVPEKPPPMKYQELPIYECPHFKYKDYIVDKEELSCPERKEKLVHKFLLPYVRNIRQSVSQTCSRVKCEFGNWKSEVDYVICKNKQRLLHSMRCPNNMAVRQGTVAMGGLLGYFISRKKGIPTRLFTTSLGLLTTGAICFPKETDEAFRSVTFNTAKSCIAVYNTICSKMFKLGEQVPCSKDMPPPPPACPPRKSVENVYKKPVEEAPKVGAAKK